MTTVQPRLPAPEADLVVDVDVDAVEAGTTATTAVKGRSRIPWRFLGGRALFYLFTLWAAITINFFLPRMMKGDAVTQYLARNRNGYGMVVSDQPYLIQADGNDEIAVITSGANAYYFDKVGAAYQPRFYLGERLTHDTGAKQFIFTDEAGQVFRFHDFDASHHANQRGQFQSFADAGGNLTAVTSWTASIILVCS